jgi:hypothetical protein
VKLNIANLPRHRMHLLNLRHHSLARGNVLVIGSLLVAILLSDFPHNRATMLLVLPTLLAIIGTGETIRCMRLRWGYYHAGVILCIYMDLMVICMILFFLIYPYWHFLSATT